MRYAVMGTGMVGRAIAGKLAELGHQVAMGTRDVAASRARTEPDRTGVSLAGWLGEHPDVTLATYADAAAHGEVVVNATSGDASLDALQAAGAERLDGKTLIDISNPLDFSSGFPPTLFIADTDSLAERIQRALPGARVVKTLNTVTASLMVDPASVGRGDHSVFVSGDDAKAKTTATEMLREFGWIDIVDLGDLSTARGTEMYLALWIRLMGPLGTPSFNVKVVR